MRMRATSAAFIRHRWFCALNSLEGSNVMLHRFWNQSLLALLVVLSSLAASLGVCHAGQVLVSDRLSNSVFRYSNDGDFLGTLLTDNVNLNQPSGLQLSPDQSKLYVASSQNNQVVRYDYNRVAGTATNATVFATTGLSFPNSIAFSADGDTIYVSNLGGTGVAQFNTDGTSAGAAINGSIAGGSIFQYSGLAFAPGGELLVGGFQDFPAGTSGAIAKSDVAITAISDFIAPSATLNGVGNLLAIGNDLYATAGFAGTVNKFNATTGVLSGTFSPITGLQFPASMIAAPNGDGILVGALGFVNGTGSILHYDFDGNLIGTFASANANPIDGFTEATGMVQAVPEPGSLAMLGIGLGLVGLFMRRRLVSRG
jgi:SMP-30/Gluconolactonase/LRE-like region/PEP-CTERM motif